MSLFVYLANQLTKAMSVALNVPCQPMRREDADGELEIDRPAEDIDELY